MIVRTLVLLSLIVSLQPSLAAAAEPATPNAGVPAGFSESARPAGSAETDVWPEHALPDADAARQGPVRVAVHARANRNPGPAVAPNPAGERAGRGRTAARPYPADPSRRAGRWANPGHRAEARLHHGALFYRHDRRALADRRDRARQPLPPPGPGGRAGSSRRRPSALSGAPNRPISTATRW